ncbi:methyltransferase domain-containing protein [Fulvivirga sedimenti]|uniref:Class I SAM-dependent methyltransferase n=1 Tax=Fulvivirga sedimenti TaxID=2879465 RepID=A0A9X1KY90_9BACT|nr:methyltransferase domain-containing protein [Fulvivirga sedimenti]MCA6074592.1 class I SAM-dependent methyltransferase [Fulvivirga sedimenti]MCA6075769.1 class I SAM-dependent methyltransferase [Fulvivirga sedimenti]MCA6076897.1 class I SAM-dependent methyltransferase [Fulvivirga sedimenti]
MHKKYDSEFYGDRDARTRYSAERLIGRVLELTDPNSVVDLGCGVGTWLKVFKEKGIAEVMGLEGSWVNVDNVVIGKDEFMHAELKQPLSLQRKFDLAISLEVAEHLEEEYAEQFVINLTSLAPLILFSAAIPFQGGVKHFNEQWPSYWQSIFKKHGYILLDTIRPHVWNDPRVESWYAQNSFMYVKESELDNYPKLVPYKDLNQNMVDAVLPEVFERKMRNYTLTKWFKNKLGLLR